MQAISRIPKLKDHNINAAREWFAAMQEAGLLFHPDDDPQDISLIATNEPLFTTAEVTAVRAIMIQLFEALGDEVYEACYPIFMEACNLAAA
ncbi:hypothetical protein [Pseudomonas paeninsulae]|uniref:hypothetical protein n=1 Tax=Pseudomonas paeninsulae TaxID=3110772 RepID=UPI002D780FB1|nr:hypothetical protein [Pseudomonas sp. IT1137]